MNNQHNPLSRHTSSALLQLETDSTTCAVTSFELFLDMICYKIVDQMNSDFVINIITRLREYFCVVSAITSTHWADNSPSLAYDRKIICFYKATYENVLENVGEIILQHVNVISFYQLNITVMWFVCCVSENHSYACDNMHIVKYNYTQYFTAPNRKREILHVVNSMI